MWRVALILPILALAGCGVDRQQQQNREQGAIRSIQILHQAEVQYFSQYGKYAGSLAELGPPASGAASPAAADLIGNDLAGGLKFGYKFTLTTVPGGYHINADPEVHRDGSRAFFSDQTMVIRQVYGPGPALPTSDAIR